MSDPVVDKIQNNPKYQELRKKRSSFGWLLTLLMMVALAPTLSRLLAAADPVRAAQIAVIDQRYWQYRPDGELWAPEAGINLAFREINAARWGKAGGDTPPPTTAASASG